MSKLVNLSGEPMKRLPLNKFERLLLTKNRHLILKILISQLNEDGYYITKSRDKMFLIEDSSSGDVIITGIQRKGKNGIAIFSGMFIDQFPADDMFERDNSLLPVKCELPSYDKETKIPIKLLNYDNESISFKYKNVYHTIRIVPEIASDLGGMDENAKAIIAEEILFFILIKIGKFEDEIYRDKNRGE